MSFLTWLSVAVPAWLIYSVVLYAEGVASKKACAGISGLCVLGLGVLYYGVTSL